MKSRSDLKKVSEGSLLLMILKGKRHLSEAERQTVLVGLIYKISFYSDFHIARPDHHLARGYLSDLPGHTQRCDQPSTQNYILLQDVVTSAAASESLQSLGGSGQFI